MMVGIVAVCGSGFASSLFPAVGEFLNGIAWWLAVPAGGGIAWWVVNDIRSTVALNRECARSWRENGPGSPDQKPADEPAALPAGDGES
jgi:hypothetical protein